jgi:hypothetical protein
VVDDLGTPQVNIAYGAWYLRYLPARYGGEGHVDRWIAAARERREALTIDAIPGLRRPGARGARRVSALLALLALAYARGSGGLERAFSARRA